MRQIAAVIGLFLILFLSHNTEAFSSELWRSRRSLDLDEIYDFNLSQMRLPKEVVPTTYRLEIEPFYEENFFRSRVKMNVTWTYTSDMITLNADPDLKIVNYSVRITEGSFEEREKGLPLLGVNVASVTHPTEKKPWYVIHLEQMLKKGSSCEVDITVIGNLTNCCCKGLTWDAYKDSNGDEHPFVFTSFSLDKAHTVFPCMNKPQYKVPFKLSVLRPKNMTTVSNTPLESTSKGSEDGNFVWDHFEETPNMSPYQLAFIVSDFKNISPSLKVDEMDGKKVEIKVWVHDADVYLKHMTDIPDKAVRIMNYLQKYFNSSIMLPKLDLIKIPWYHCKAGDYWGLIFFKKLNDAPVWDIAYELIYQWIGQYITPFRWSDAPVSKALNSFLASMTTNDINPLELEGKWPMTMLYSFYYEFGKLKPFSRVEGIRNEATSRKTELVFRMFYYILGKEVFQKGVQNFIQQESEGNLRTYFAEDIYNRLNEVANELNILPEGLTINNIAGPWINWDRLPLVTVIRDYETKTIALSQKVYLREAPRYLTPKTSYEWDIPIVMISEDDLSIHQPCQLWLRKSNGPKNFTINDVTDKDHFIIVNPEEIGMFPVNYDTNNWKLLTQFLRGPNRDKLPSLTKAKLLHDSWNLAYSGELSFDYALNMTLFLKEERNHVVWEPVFMMFDHIGRRIEGTSVYPKFEAYIRVLLKPLYEELMETKEDDEPSWKTHMRGMTKNFLCRAGYEPCLVEAKEQFKKWLTEEEPYEGHPVKNQFICLMFKWGNAEEWEQALQHVVDMLSKHEHGCFHTHLLRSLASCPKDLYKIERLLNVTILEQNQKFTDRDINQMFVTLSLGAAGYTALFNFLSDNWELVQQRLEDKPELWQCIVELLISSFSTEKTIDIIPKLTKSYPGKFNPSDTMISKAFRTEQKNWVEKNLGVIDNWLSQNLPEEELNAIQAGALSTMMTPSMD